MPLLIVAGEASGDLHAARLVSELARLRPDLAFFGIGGDEMEAAGVERLADSSEITVVGIVEVLKILSRAREIFQQILDAVEQRRPPVAVLVDFPDFNLRLARRLSEMGVQVVYYISPQVWAWRRGRVKLISRVVSRMLVLFPFEVDFYEQAGVPVTCVGHPLVDEVPELPHVWDREETLATVDTHVDGAGRTYRLALLPGSRRSEIEALLPVLLEGADRLRGRLKRRGAGLETVLIQAPGVSRELLDELIAASPFGAEGKAAEGLTVAREDRFRELAACHAAFCASGTATLELGLLGTPMVVVYRLRRPSYWLARLLVRLPHFSLVNLVLDWEGRERERRGRGVVPELLQSEVNPDRLAREAEALLTEPERRAEMRAALGELRTKLGAGGAAAAAAVETARELPPPRSSETAVEGGAQ